MSEDTPEEVRSYTPKEVADLFNVHVRSVTRWAGKGKLEYFRTPGGHRRYYADQVDAMIRGGNELA
jgi:excisionase family DNA binding protein